MLENSKWNYCFGLVWLSVIAVLILSAFDAPLLVGRIVFLIGCVAFVAPYAVYALRNIKNRS